MRALDKIAVLSSKTKLPNYTRDYIAKLHVMICKIEAIDDSLVDFVILDCLKEHKELENNKLKALSDLIAQIEEAVHLKERRMDVMDLEIHY
nr:hypothetical protein [Tanacetum cinerariifolium]